MSRASWKVPYIAPLFFAKRFLTKKSSKLWVRNSVIPSNFLNKSFYLYNGRTYLPVAVKADMIGHKFGEFSVTKVLGYRPKKVKKNQKKRR